MTQAEVKGRLEYLRGELEAERISYSGLAELQDLASYIEPHDVQLLEAAGVPEYSEVAPDAGNVGRAARSVESGWEGRIVAVDGEFYKLQGAGGTQWFQPAGLEIVPK